MALDGPGIHVDVGAVEQAATGITQSVADQDSFELADLCGEPECTATAGYMERWRRFVAGGARAWMCLPGTRRPSVKP